MKRQPAKDFRDLILEIPRSLLWRISFVWQKAHQFVWCVYRYNDLFPKFELFGLISQLRRTAVSIPANRTEGIKKNTRPEKAGYFKIGQGSLDECRYYLILAQDLNYGDVS
jgi:four helix bundle protein